MARASIHAASGGLVLGRYRPLKPLGSGGMGSVWHAYDERKEREVALKIVARSGTAGPRAEREATAAAQLEHPACLRAYALARDEGHVYIAYEFVPGRTLRHALEHGELDDEAAVEAAAQILDGLAHAHAAGIVHRDVKPSNVLLAGDDTAALSDFGLARAADSTRLTEEGQVVGTPHYLAPELIEGCEATRASDVYALGCVLHECLVGSPPFAGRALAEIGFAHLVEPPPDAHDLRPELPADVGAALLSALAKNPSDRPTTGTALARLLHVARTSSPA
jgi:serine/threonine protein kinase